jgi:hypothetical protein
MIQYAALSMIITAASAYWMPAFAGMTGKYDLTRPSR